MKRLFGLTLLALSLGAIPAQAAFFKSVGNGNMPVGPWYLYWPMEAHFQTPASPQYPYWPAPMTLPLPQGAGQGMGGQHAYAPSGQMQGQAPPMGNYNPYAGMGNPGMPTAGMGGYNPYGMQTPGMGMPAPNGYNPYGVTGGYGGMNSYPYAPTLPAGGGSNNSTPTIRIGN
jgi:hypothetical protein